MDQELYERVDERLDNLDRICILTSKDVQAVKEDVQAVKEDVQAVKEDVQAVKDHLNALSDDHRNLESKVDRILERLDKDD